MTKTNEIETVQMTAAELNRRIAQEREPSKFLGWPSPYRQEISPLREWVFSSRPEWSWKPRKDYLTDAAAALELLEELPISHAAASLIESYQGRSVDERLTAKNLLSAICCGWYLWKTGKRVELIEG